MRKHISKLIVLALIAILAIGLVVGLVACNDKPQTPKDPTPPAEHTQHTPDSTTTWHSDDANHWHLCVEGGEKLSQAAHTFELTVDGDQKTLACSICGKTVDASAATLKSNDTEHWYEIERGGETIKTAPVAHDFELLVEGEQKSLKCSVCEKTLDASAATMNKNAEGHWYEIVKDGTTYKTASTQHSKSAKAVDKGDQHAYSCTVCQFEYAPENHTPGADAHKVDEHNHAYTCTACDKSIEEGHDLSYVPDQEGGHHAVCADCEYVGSNEECVKSENAQCTDSQDGEHHTFVCEKCETTVAEGHTLGGYRTDASNHWKVCSDCKAVVGSEAHTSKEMTDPTNHWTACEVCNEVLVQPVAHTREYKLTEDQSKHYEGCKECSYKFTEPTEHTHDGWTAAADGKNCGFTCSDCKLEVSLPHDYTESASCIRCEHDNPWWTLKDNENETYTLVGFSYNTNLAEFQGTKDEPFVLNLPKTYKGKPIVGMDKNGTKVFFQQAQASTKDTYCELIIPEGYKTIGNINNSNLMAVTGHMTLTRVYIPSTIESIYSWTMFTRSTDIYLADLTKYLEISAESDYGQSSTVGTSIYLKGEDGEYQLAKDLVIPEGVTEIKNRYAFHEVALDSLELPASLVKIDLAAAYYDKINVLKIKTLKQALTLDITNFIRTAIMKVKDLVIEDLSEQSDEFRIPADIKEISGGLIFAYPEFDSVTKLYIHKDVTSLGTLDFNNVKEVYFESNKNLLTVMDNSAWDALNNAAGPYDPSTLKVYVDGSELKDLVITDDMLGEGDTIKSLSYNASVTSIKFETSKKITFEGNYTFALNTNLTSVDFGSITTDDYPTYWFGYCRNLAGVVKLPEGPTKITGNGLFSGNSTITDIILPKSLTNLSGSGQPFNGSLAANIIFQDGVTVQDNLSLSFFNNWKGSKLVVPKGLDNSVQNIVSSSGLTELKRVYYQGTDAEWTAIKLKLAAVTNRDESIVINATALAYAASDPGEGNNAYTWAYEDNGTLKEWYPEPECEGGHTFVYQHNDTQHWGECSKCNYKLNHVDHIVTLNTLGHDETQCWDICSVCETPFNKTNHTPGTEYVHDAAGHQRLCTRCGEVAETVQSHEADTASYQTNGEQHWRLCKDCGEPIEHTDHTAGEEHGHDESTHWSLCKDCGAKMDKSVEPHNNEGEVQGVGDANGHMSNCSVCGAEGVLVAHSYTVDGEGFADGVCTKCHYSHFTLNDQGLITAYTGTDIEKLAIPAQIGGKDVTGIANGTISGSSSSNYNYAPVFKSRNNILRVVKFPDSDKFTSLGDCAFAGNTVIEEVIFNKYVTKIGLGTGSKKGYTFYYCPALQKVTIPQDSMLTEILNYAFASSGITEFVIPNGVTTLGEYAFNWCESLTSIKFPETSETLKAIPASFLANCTTLSEITLPNYIATIGDSAFSSTPIVKLVIPDSVTSLGKLGTLSSLTYLEIGTGVTTIGTQWATTLSSIERVWFKGVLTSIPASFVGATANMPSNSYWYFSNDLESLNGLFTTKLSTSGKTNMKRVNAYIKSDEDPQDKVEELGEYIDGYWHDVNGEPKHWGKYIVFFQTDFTFNLNNGVDDKTLALEPYFSGEIAFKDYEGITVSGEGVVTFTKPGYFTITAYISDAEEETSVELHILVYSDENYIVGTIGGNEISAKQDEYVMKADSEKEFTYLYAIDAQVGDKFMVAASGVTEKYGKDILKEAERDFVSVGDDGYITFTKADKFTITVTYGKDGVTLDVDTAAYVVQIMGRQNCKGLIASAEFRPAKEGTIKFDVLLEASKFTTQSWPDFYIQVVTPDGTIVDYNADTHGMKIGGTAFKSGAWKTNNAVTGNFWYDGNTKTTMKWTLSFTVNSEGTITLVEIASA